MSDDGSATLEIPVGAMPAGVQASDVKVARRNIADASVTVDGAAPPFGYHLTPDGTVFQKPVTLRVAAPVGPAGPDAMQAFLVSGDQSVAAAKTDTTYDGRSKTVAISVTIPHFTDVVVVPISRTWTPHVSGPSQVVVNQLFQMTGSGTFAGGVAHVKVGTRATTFSVLPVAAGGDFVNYGLVPADVEDAPPLAARPSPISETRSFTCTKAGQAVSNYTMFVTWQTFRQAEGGEPTRVSSTTSVATFAVLACMSGGASSTTTSSTVVDRSRVPGVLDLAASLSVPVTTFTIDAVDPAGGNLGFVWKMTGETCGTPGVPWTQTGPSAHWSHSSDKPDSCKHTGIDHAVDTTVTVTTTSGPNKGASVSCSIHGTETQDKKRPSCDILSGPSR